MKDFEFVMDPDTGGVSWSYEKYEPITPEIALAIGVNKIAGNLGRIADALETMNNKDQK